MSRIASGLRASPPATLALQKTNSRSEAGGSGADIDALVARNAELAERVAQLQTALESRVVIEQAKGMLAAQLDVSVDEAFDLLRRTARSHRIKLHELAAEAVAARSVPPKVVCLLFGAAVERQLETAVGRRSRSLHVLNAERNSVAWLGGASGSG